MNTEKPLIHNMEDDYKIDVIGFGALNLDKLFEVDEIAGVDGESFIKSIKESCGGSAANTIIGLSRLGLSTSYIGKIAEDDEGEILETNLMSEGVYLNNLIYSDSGSSGVVYGFVDKNGERELYVNPGVNDEIAIGDIVGSGLNNAKIIHYSSFVGDSFKAQEDLIDILPKDIILSFDPGIIYVKKGIKKLKKIFNRTNILLINEIELLELFKGEMNFKDLAKLLFSQGIETVVVKRGKHGVYALNSEENVEIPVFNVKSIDTTAAGDSFNAGFLYSYLNGYSLKNSCIIGNWVASRVVEDFGLVNFPKKDEMIYFEKELDIAIKNNEFPDFFNRKI
ncbi:MAG: carbohydrate kinase family protein [Methanobrevibacter sp.]|jgi:ribokinase|nr:carbohydrate kinase family protein [Candidatus Methanoflexus mossambicus]